MKFAVGTPPNNLFFSLTLFILICISLNDWLKKLEVYCAEDNNNKEKLNIDGNPFGAWTNSADCVATYQQITSICSCHRYANDHL